MVYDLKTPRAPALKGLPLEALARILDRPRAQKVLGRQMLRVAGLPELSRRRPTTGAVPEHRPLPADEWNAPEQEPELGALLAGHQPVAHLHTVADFDRAYRTGRTSPVEVAERFLAAHDDAESRSPPLRAFISVRREEVLREAAASHERWKRGEPLSVLDGVPVPVKDEIDVIGHPTRMGTRFYGGRADRDATCVQRLRALGALVVGKTNMHELGAGPTGRNPIYGTPLNPWRTDHYPGGSSSGSAVAVAAGLAPVALGCDAGGSVRLPAAFCGLVGLKPTWGRVSKHGVAPFAWTVGHVGPLGASARDAAIGYLAVAGRDGADPATLAQPPVDLEGFLDDDIRGLRVGIFRPWFEDADDEVVEGCYAQVRELEQRGAEVVEVVLPDLELARVVHLVTLGAEAVAAHTDEHWDQHAEMTSPEVRIGLSLARAFTRDEILLARRHRVDLTRRLLELFDLCDVIATPTAASTAPRRRTAPDQQGVSDVTQLARTLRFTPLANLTGVPAISIPAGFDRLGLPIGFHLMGRPWAESQLLRLARVLEAKQERRRPRVHYQLL